MDVMCRKMSSLYTSRGELSHTEEKAMEVMQQLHDAVAKEMAGLQLPSPFNPPLRDLEVQLKCLSKFGSSDMSELVRRLLYTKPRVQIEAKFASLSPLPSYEEVAETSEVVRSFFGPQGPKPEFIRADFSFRRPPGTPSTSLEEAMSKREKEREKEPDLEFEIFWQQGFGGGHRSGILQYLRRIEKDIIVDDNELKQWM
ncbi:hypothetical protein C8R47DRAFT_1137586 [Mycena vitilis]|nr:hypothetical protein C8R47DRAFT_1137586 [Mycena vitilis]